jgi:phosphoribosylamine-glycine ligase
VPIEGIEMAEGRQGVKIFHAGTRSENGVPVTAGGRVLSVVCVREGLSSAVRCAYGAIGATGVHFEGMAYRTDIAFRALAAGSL